MDFDWNELAFASKKPLNALKATFIAAPRELSAARFTQLIKEYLPKGNIILGLAKEPFVLGFEDQPQFRTLQRKTVQPIIDKVNKSPSKYKIATLGYAQRDLLHVINGLDVRQFLGINGSWKYSFHTQAPYYALMQKQVPYQLISPFTDEDEAKEYEKRTDQEIIKWLDKAGIQNLKGKICTEQELMRVAALRATRSYDNSFQTGLSLGEKTSSPGKYKLIISTFNTVVPYQTYALHHGSSREKFFSPPNDLNHYDTVHAEVDLLTKYIAYLEENDKSKRTFTNLKNTTLFINLMPCPTCARMLACTEIAEFVYREDHSDGYAVKMLELAGKKVRRIV